MFDPSVPFDTRLRNEFGLKTAAFYATPAGKEEELKYIIASATRAPFDRIHDAIHSKPNRILDSRAWVSNPYVLVTYNMDTVDGQLAKAGFSMRVRFAYDANDSEEPVKQADMCIKTSLPTGKNVVMFKQTRGEWEVELDDLKPNMTRMIDAHRKTENPLPPFFMMNRFKDDDYFVESIGCTLRNVYPSYEIVQHKSQIFVPTFLHGEDVLNVFMTPTADEVTAIDHEGEAEFIGIKGISPGDISASHFEDIKGKSMELMDRTIMSADSCIERNLRSKSVRARMALEHVYGLSHDLENLAAAFGHSGGAMTPSQYALGQKIRPADVDLDRIWHHVGHHYEKHKRTLPPDFDPFQYKR